jgi:hypothetical protein
MKLVMLGLVLLVCTPAAFSDTPRQTKKPAKKMKAVETDTVFPITGNLTFEGQVVRGSIRKSAIDSLLARRVYLGGNINDEYGKYGLGFIYEEGKLPAFSCQEWAQSKRLGLDSSFNTYERTMDSFFIDTCSFLFALKDAKPATQSFIANPQVGLSNLNLLPVKMLNTLSGDNVDGLDDTTASQRRIRQLVAKRKAKILYRMKSHLAVEYQFDPEEKLYGYRMNFDERGRADFDGDGIEDIFISTSWYVTQGTFRAYNYFLLTRRSPTAPFEIKEFELSAIKENPHASFPGLTLKSNQLKRLSLAKQTYGKAWPFEEEKGELACAEVGSVAVFWIAGGTAYPLNVWARASTIDGVAVASDTRMIENGESLSPIFNRAFAMCQRGGAGQSSQELQKASRQAVQGFYNHLLGKRPQYPRAVLSRELRRQLKKDEDAQARNTDGGIVGLDFDPFLATNGDPYEHYLAGKVTVKSDRYWVEVYGRPSREKSEKPVVVPELMFKDGRWIIVNFHYGKSEYPVNENLLSLLKFLRADRQKTTR